jgi:hypothetical protein
LGNIKGDIQILAKESLVLCERKQHKPWFDEAFWQSLHQRKQAKVQGLLDQNESNEDNLNNVRREAIRYFRNRNREYLEAKINELETNSKNKNIRGLYKSMNYFKKG